MKFINQVNTIFFDLDHTLWDFEKNSSLTFKNIFNNRSFPFSHSKFLTFYIPINHKYWSYYSENKISTEQLRTIRLKETFKALKFNHTAKFIDEISCEYIKTLPTQTFLFEGVIDLLKHLKPKYNLHIITNGFEDVQYMKLKNSKILTYFDKIINPENSLAKKPNSKIFNYALSLVKENPKNCLMIGNDFFADVMGALNVGMNAIHFNPTNEPKHEKCTIVNSIKELHKLLN